MRPILMTVLLAILVGCTDSKVAMREDGLQAELDKYFRALTQGKHRITIEMMDPRFFPNQAVRSEAVALIEKSTATFNYHSITNGEPFGRFKGSNSQHCFVPYVSDAEIRGQRATVKSHLLATRYHGGTNWFFVDIGTKPRKLLSKYYENLPDALPTTSIEASNGTASP
jgi:hypothetical protein